VWIPNPAQLLVERYRPQPYVQALGPRQRAVYNCQSRFKKAEAGRQAGKSHTALAWLLGGRPGEVSLAFARTDKQIQGILLEPAYELNELYDLGLEVTDRGKLIVERSGARVELAGIRDQATAEKYRGRRYRRIFGDEAQSYRDEILRWIVFNVLQPTLLKKGGDLMLGGTPGMIHEGLWFDICRSDEKKRRWPVDFSDKPWTLLDNPFIPDPERFIEDILSSNGWTRETPAFQREYMGQWVIDTSGLIYEWQGQFEEAPEAGYTVLGVDLGYDEGVGYVVCRMAERPHVYVVEAFSATESLPQDIAPMIRQLCQKHHVNDVIADTSGGSKTTVEQLEQQFGLKIYSAKSIGQQGKRANIDLVRGMLKNGTLHVCEAAKELTQEWSVLPWDELRRNHMAGYQDECTDALIYASKLFQLRDAEAKKAPADLVSLELERRKRAAERIAKRRKFR
jgi:hypothetical protein